MLATNDEVEKRLQICGGCEFLRTVFGIKQCSVCKCSISMKTRFNGSECPKGKWQ